MWIDLAEDFLDIDFVEARPVAPIAFLISEYGARAAGEVLDMYGVF